MQQAAALICFEEAFENKLCDLRELVLKEGSGWISGKQKGDCLTKITQDLFFPELKVKAKGAGRLIIQEIYDKKSESKKLYRLKLEMVYQTKTSKKKIPFYGYLTVET